MTKPHIYLHTSNFDASPIFQQDESFQMCWEYNSFDLQKTFPFEYGRIKTGLAYYHVLLGHIPSDSCPWCNGRTELIKQENNEGLLRMYVECQKCLSRGPLFSLYSVYGPDSEEQKRIEEKIMRIYITRKTWDADFINPYE